MFRIGLVEFGPVAQSDCGVVNDPYVGPPVYTVAEPVARLRLAWGTSPESCGWYPSHEYRFQAALKKAVRQLLADAPAGRYYLRTDLGRPGSSEVTYLVGPPFPEGWKEVIPVSRRVHRRLPTTQ